MEAPQVRAAARVTRGGGPVKRGTEARWFLVYGEAQIPGIARPRYTRLQWAYSTIFTPDGKVALKFPAIPGRRNNCLFPEHPPVPPVPSFMPELPEVQTVVDTLRPKLLGAGSGRSASSGRTSSRRRGRTWPAS